MALSVEQYNIAERAARIVACNRIIEAATPATFTLRGDPVHAGNEDDIVRYFDGMHELGEEAA